jgi:hypothetical protein
MNDRFPERTSCFQGIRLIALSAIISSHLGASVLGNAKDWVSFFFCVSGFLIYYNKGQGEALDNNFLLSIKRGGKYWLSKACTIFPIWWIVLFAEIVLFKEKISFDIIRKVFLFQAFIPMPAGSFGSVWFISAILFCYLLAYPMMYLIKRQSINALLLIGGCLVVIYLSVIHVGGQLGDYSLWFSYICPIWRVIEFFYGMMICRFLIGISYIKKHSIGAVLFLTVLLYLFLIRSGFLDRGSYMFIHLVIIGHLFMFGGPIFNAVFGNAFVWKLSHYFVYVYLVQDITTRLFSSLLSTPVIVFLTFAIGVVFGTVFEGVKSIISFLHKSYLAEG